MFKILFISLIISLTSCLHKKCDNAYEKGRSQAKDTALMYLWRYTDNLIKPDALHTDSGYISFKRNGDYCWAFQRININSFEDVWFTKNDLIYRTYCSDYVPHDDKKKYKINNDTLFIWGYMMDGSFSNTPRTYIKVQKY